MPEPEPSYGTQPVEHEKTENKPPCKRKAELIVSDATLEQLVTKRKAEPIVSDPTLALLKSAQQPKEAAEASSSSGLAVPTKSPTKSSPKSAQQPEEAAEASPSRDLAPKTQKPVTPVTPEKSAPRWGLMRQLTY